MKNNRRNNLKKNFMNKICKKIISIALTMILTMSLFYGMDITTYAATVKQNININKIYATKTGIKIKWTNSYSAKGYVIYRSVNGGKYSSYDTSTKKYYTDSDVDTGEKYSYKVKAYKYINRKKKYSSKSKASSAYVAKPDSVSGVSAKISTLSATVTWKVNPYATGYYVYKSTDNKTWTYIDSVNDNLGLYIDNNVDSTVETTYKIKAYEVVDGEKYFSVKSSVSKFYNEFGIDVSYHNGTIDWKKVKQAGVSFAMIRMGYGTTKGGIKDSKLDYNYKQARKYGVKVGFYVYSYADNKKEALNEAKFTAKLLKTYNKHEYPIAFDFENPYRNKSKYKSSNTTIIKTYCDYLEKLGYDTSVYSYLNFFTNATNYRSISKYGIWLARWTFDTSRYSDCGIPNVQMWQYSDNGTISGIGSGVDLNLSIVN